MIKPEVIEQYIRSYLNEIKALAESLPEERRLHLPDHLVSNQEIRVYITSKTGIAIDYIGISPHLQITFRSSDRSLDDLIFPPTEFDVPPEQGAMRLKSLNESSPNEPEITITLEGDRNGVSLIKAIGGGHLFAFDYVTSNPHGRNIITNLYVQREYSDHSLRSRYVRYVEFYPDNETLFTEAKAVANARKDFEDCLPFVRSAQIGLDVQKYLKIGDVIHQLKKSTVVVLGKDTPPEIDLLTLIRDELRTMDYNAILVKEERDIPAQSPEEKVKLLTLIAKFSIMEDSTAGGHIAEFEYCKNNRVPLILLRKVGKGSTWMIGDASLVDMNFIKTFEYSDSNLNEVLRNATKWVEDFVHKRAAAYEAYFPWRTKS